MMIASAITLAFMASGTASYELVAESPIRAGDIVSWDNSELDGGGDAAADDPRLGREVKRTVYAGQPITMDNTQAPRIVKRNQTVTVRYIKGGLEISTSGRALGDAAAGETISVMNLSSRQTIQGVVHKEGWVIAQ